MNKTQKSMVVMPVLAFIISIALITFVGCMGNPNKDLILLEIENVEKVNKDYVPRIENDKDMADVSKRAQVRWLKNWLRRLKSQLESIEKQDK